VSLPLVQAGAEDLPFAAASFDVVFCDHGAMSFTDPAQSVPEAARVLKLGGLFAFNMSSPLRDLCWIEEQDRLDDRLHGNYFELHRIEDANQVCFQLPYGEWIRLFRRCRLQVEDLIELRPGPDARTTYGDYASVEWARRLPAENLWKLRKEP
jgi:ubiquinone/menaquinone biosynthesis C-methylase UbiE